MRANGGHPSVAAVTDAQRTAPDRGARGSARLTFERVNPLEHADAIKALFLGHERPEFPEYFERAYPDAVADGATSWVGWDEHGRLCAHIAQFPRQFLLGRRPLQAALLANLMIATEHRTFWPALALARRVVKDVRASGAADFVYADPNDRAQAVLRAAGLQTIGALCRFVLPLNDGPPGVAQAIRFYHLLERWHATPLVAIVAGGEPEGEFPPGDAGSLRPVRDASVFRSRLAGYPSTTDRWYTFHPPGLRNVLVGKALVRGPDRDGVAVICAVQCEPMSLLTSLHVTLAHRLRDGGAARVEVWAMLESQLAHALRRAGFLRRREAVPVLAQALTAHGVEATAAGCDWQILAVDLDR
jgi:hypothetical protein